MSDRGSGQTKVDSVFDLLGYEPSIEVEYEFGNASKSFAALLAAIRHPSTRDKYLDNPGARNPEARVQELYAELGENITNDAIAQLASIETIDQRLQFRFDFAAMTSTLSYSVIRVLHVMRAVFGARLRSMIVRQKMEGAELDLRNASSGELAILVSFLALASAIVDRSLILIDEPEISLHPEWQARYLDLLSHAFSSYRRCHYIVATHSPLTISDIAKDRSTVVSLDKKDIASAEQLSGKSSDELLVNAFGVVGNENLYIKQQVLHALRLVSDGECRSAEFHSTMESFTRVRSALGPDDAVGQIIDELESVGGLS